MNAADTIPVGDPAAPLGRGHVDAHRQTVEYLVDLTERVAELEARLAALEGRAG
jgi:hypothetical protein